MRDTVRFGEGRAGNREKLAYINFKHRVLDAEVFLSGFNMFYTREGHDHEVMVDKVDSHVTKKGVRDPDGGYHPETVEVKLEYNMADEDTSDSDDYNDCFIAFTVLAHTIG